MNYLVDYLCKLDAIDNGWSLWVNPEDFDDFRIGQDIFENGGILDDFVRIGSLGYLSRLGMFSRIDTLRLLIDDGVVDLGGLSPQELIEQYEDELLEDEWMEEIDDQIDEWIGNYAVEVYESFLEEKQAELISEIACG